MYKEAIQDAISTHELPSEWSSALLSEAEHVAQKKKTAKYRKDLRKLPFVTIDGEDAKDFDDAIYCVKNTSGYKLYVAIADVSFYVEANSKLDKEAKKRGTSIYFPETVIPMLPENLSNGICSLRPNEDRCSMICEMSIDLDGTRKKYKFYSGLINSKARLTYNQVEKHFKKSSTIKQSIVRESIKHLFDLTNLRLKLRNQRKALEINPTEAILELNKNKEVNNIVVKRNLFAHKLVEESMLLANESAAEFMHDRLDLGVYRIHEDPDPSKLETLKKHFKVPAQIAKKLSPLEVINSCLKEAHKKKDETGQILVLQTLARAEYSTNNLGHFGLQLKQYSHFTSPIRRYPDLLVHRLINASLAHKKSNMRQNELQDECENSSMLERRAEKASRQVEQVLICSYLKNKIGASMEGVITGVTDFGLFINLERYFISGLLHVSDLPDDRYQYLQDRGALKGRRRGGIYKLGQKIKVKITAIFPLERKINLVISNGKK
jgi:ribonuclease R